MGTTKIKAYTKRTLDLAQIANGLSHPARITIIQYLFNHYVGNSPKFQELTGLSRATISQHVKELINAKLIFADYIKDEPNYQLRRNADRRIQMLIEDIIG